MAEYNDYIQDIVKTKKVRFLFFCHATKDKAAVMLCVNTMCSAQGVFSSSSEM